MDKWKNRILKMNFKKIGICYLLIAVIFAVAVGCVTYSQFEGKATAQAEVGNDREDNVKADTDREDKENREEKESQEDSIRGDTDREDGYRGEDHEWDTEEPIIEAVGIAGLVLFALYWLLIFLWTIKKSIQRGADPMVFGILALCFNLAGVLLFYLYCHWQLHCSGCGKLQKKNSLYCPYCGMGLHKKCSHCDTECSIDDEYCSHCGKKL